MKVILALTAILLASRAVSAQDLEFQRELAKKNAVSVGDALMLWYGLVFEPDPKLTPESACTKLVEKGIIAESWRKSMKSDISMGELCTLICTSLQISGGIAMHVLGPTSRYAYKECVRLKLVKATGPHARVSGRDLLSVAARMEEWLALKKK